MNEAPIGKGQGAADVQDVPANLRQFFVDHNPMPESPTSTEESDPMSLLLNLQLHNHAPEEHASSESPDLVAGEKRKRKRRKPFQFETGGAPQPTLKKLPMNPEDSSHDDALENIERFRAEIEAMYAPLLNRLEETYKIVENTGVVAVLGTATDLKHQIEKISKEYAVWNALIPWAIQSVGRQRISSEGTAAINVVLSHYNLHHPTRLPEIIKKISQLFLKEDRIITNNFKKSTSRNLPSTEPEQMQTLASEDTEEKATQTEQEKEIPAPAPTTSEVVPIQNSVHNSAFVNQLMEVLHMNSTSIMHLSQTLAARK